MPLRIEDYALIGDTQTAALVGRDGSIDWMCLPSFDSAACFAALLGGPEHGRWLLAPAVVDLTRVTRQYREGTLILETTFVTATGTVRVTDFMPPRKLVPDLVRVVEGIDGEVAMRTELVIRLDYGAVVPWVHRLDDDRLVAVGGADAVVLQEGGGVRTHGEELATVGNFTVRAGQRVPFVLSWYPSHQPAPQALDPISEMADTEAWWREWSGRCTYRGPWREPVMSSLLTLKALTFGPTGGIVAAPTTSLPEWPGSVRNWDYRYCWLRDATFTLYSLMSAGYKAEAASWRDWLLRVVAGDPAKLQIMYGIKGHRRLPEYQLDWLPGYENSKPVRVGNAAVGQVQLDVFGEVMDTLYEARRAGLECDPASWNLQKALLDFLEGAWRTTDEGLWEVRGPRQHFTHSKVMAWVGFDRAVKSVELLKMDGPGDRWRALRDTIHADVCAHAWDSGKQAFTQSYGSKHLDASLLLIPQVGFLPASDPRVGQTVSAIERELVHGGLVMRYLTEEGQGGGGGDGLPPGEGAFLACSFWLADCYTLLGQHADALALFEHLLSLRNDVGLLAEEYDPVGRRLLGNFPQAFSHVGLVNTALNLTFHQPTPAAERGGD